MRQTAPGPKALLLALTVTLATGGLAHASVSAEKVPSEPGSELLTATWLGRVGTSDKMPEPVAQ